MSKRYVEVAEQRLSLSNLEKDLYPPHGFTKAKVLEYYRRIAPFLMPHLRDRALTMKRFPGGAGGEHFYEKRCPAFRPAWVRTAEIGQGKSEVTACLVNDLQTLIWVGNLASLELHVPLARVRSQTSPDAMVFDLDPGAPADIVSCGRVALMLRDLLAELGLASFVKTSGSKGLHVLVPLNRRSAAFDDTRRFSRSVAETLQRHHGDLVTANMPKDERKGRVFINWSQNDGSKTMIAVYSLRAREAPAVSFPLAWREVEHLVLHGQADAFVVDPAAALGRVEQQGDLFRDILTTEQELPYL